MRTLIAVTSVAALMVGGSVPAIAQAKSKTEQGAPQQGPTPQADANKKGKAPKATAKGSKKNPTGQSPQVKKGEENDPRAGGKKN
jgi:hypothetical protein